MRRLLAMTALVFASALFAGAVTRPVPPTCNASVNQPLLDFIAQHQGSGSEAHLDNVMVCGTMLRNSFSQHAGHGGHGAHQVLVLTAPTTNGPITVEIVTNDHLDGTVTAEQGSPVMAYGQAYVDPEAIRAGGYTAAAGLHEPHCATHAGAEDGWVVVTGKRYPAGNCSGAH